MSEQGEKLIKASVLGVQKVGKETAMADGTPSRGTVSEYDDSWTLGQPNMKSAANLKLDIAAGRVKLHPQQRMGQGGTTIYNPKREENEVEAILGELEYKPRIEPDSKEELIKKNLSLASDMETIKAQVAILTKTMPQSATVQSVDSRPIGNYDSMSFGDVRKIAKERGINTFQKGKADIIKEIEAQKWQESPVE